MYPILLRNPIGNQYPHHEQELHHDTTCGKEWTPENQPFDVDELHNDSTTITFTGKYKDANGDTKRGKKTVFMTNGHNKDHRPDLKQILWILTVTADGAIPIRYEACDGNTLVIG